MIHSYPEQHSQKWATSQSSARRAVPTGICQKAGPAASTAASSAHGGGSGGRRGGPVRRIDLGTGGREAEAAAVARQNIRRQPSSPSWSGGLPLQRRLPHGAVIGRAAAPERYPSVRAAARRRAKCSILACTDHRSRRRVVAPCKSLLHNSSTLACPEPPQTRNPPTARTSNRLFISILPSRHQCPRLRSPRAGRCLYAAEEVTGVVGDVVVRGRGRNADGACLITKPTNAPAAKEGTPIGSSG